MRELTTTKKGKMLRRVKRLKSRLKPPSKWFPRKLFEIIKK